MFRLIVERLGFKKLHRFCLSEIQASFQCHFRVLVIRIILTISNNKVKKITSYIFNEQTYVDDIKKPRIKIVMGNGPIKH